MVLQIVPPAPPPELSPADQVRKRIATSAPPMLAVCTTCGSSEAIETRTGMIRRNGKISGGTKSMLCLSCYVKGIRSEFR